MKQDLRALHITKIQVSGDLILTDDLVTEIQKTSPADKDGDSVFFDSLNVKAGRGHYRGLLFISPPKAVRQTRPFWLIYDLGRQKKLRKHEPRITKAIEILSKLNNPIKFSISVAFEFGKRDRAKAIISLPINLSESPNLPFSKIQGIHLSCFEGKTRKHDVILDTGEDGSLWENLIFEHETKIHMELLDEIVEKAISISNKFVLLGKQK